MNTWFAPTTSHLKGAFTADKVEKLITVQTEEEDPTVWPDAPIVYASTLRSSITQQQWEGKRWHIPAQSRRAPSHDTLRETSLFLLLFILHANLFLPGGSGTTIRHNTQITHITKITHVSQVKHSTQHYTNYEGHTTHNEYSANKLQLIQN
jgi:hypothetical protein